MEPNTQNRWWAKALGGEVRTCGRGSTIAPSPRRERFVILCYTACPAAATEKTSMRICSAVQHVCPALGRYQPEILLMYLSAKMYAV